jgi:Zn-dependent M16 (insulinase) family peptidase
MLISQMIPNIIHDGDPLSVLRVTEFATRIRADFQKGQFFESLVKTFLVDNTHRLKLIMIPDPEFNQKEDLKYAQSMTKLQSILSEEEKQTIVQESVLLRKHQD